MPDEAGRFEWLGRVARAVFAGTVALLSIALIATAAMAVMELLYPQPGRNPMVWVLLVVAELIGLMWSVVLYGAVRVMMTSESAAAGAAARIDRMESLLDSTSRSIKEFAELAPLSDQAKSLLFRDRELDALREAAHEDLVRQDYARAEALVETIEQKLGFPDEAARLRAEIEESRAASMEEKIDLAIQRIDEICARHNWAAAIRQSQRILRLFPDNPKVAALPDRIKAARNDHKRELLQGYGEAVRKNDIDRGIELLHKLDMYLTPQEGAALQESARGVFKARLHNLGVQFAICVTDQQWAGAIAAGEAIIQEFPNSRFAQEVREKLDLLKARVEQVAQSASAEPAAAHCSAE